MKERPILFTGPMVRAILDGSKTQTRRLVPAWQKPSRDPSPDYPDMEWGALAQRDRRYGFAVFGATAEECARELAESACCPHGQPGDRLWVRETWQGPLFDGDQEHAYHAEPERFHKPEFCVYAADGGPKPEFMTMDDEWVCRWRPSIHMPRWACRILLEITSVRVERLQDISASDARAEGVESHEVRQFALFGLNAEERAELYRQAAIGPYRGLWESINGAGSWDANPWVWVVEFKRVAP